MADANHKENVTLFYLEISVLHRAAAYLHDTSHGIKLTADKAGVPATTANFTAL